jgi:hypothetical protein
MFEWLLGFPLRPGYQVAWILATIFCMVWVIGFRQIRLQRRKVVLLKTQAFAALKAENDVPDEGSAELLRNTLDSLEKFDRLQSDLRDRLERTRINAESARVRLESQTQLLRQSAIEMRLPHTAHEIFESLRLLPRKSALAQQADRDWHQLAGIEPGPVLVLDAVANHSVVDFRCFGRELRVTGRTFKLSRYAFDELSVFADQEHRVLTARVMLDPQRVRILDVIVSTYRPGLWVDALVDVRALIDERRETLLLHSQYRDLEKMRDDFGLSGALVPQRSGL